MKKWALSRKEKRIWEKQKITCREIWTREDKKNTHRISKSKRCHIKINLFSAHRYGCITKFSSTFPQSFRPHGIQQWNWIHRRAKTHTSMVYICVTELFTCARWFTLNASNKTNKTNNHQAPEISSKNENLVFDTTVTEYLCNWMIEFKFLTHICSTYPQIKSEKKTVSFPFFATINGLAQQRLTFTRKRKNQPVRS